MYVKLLNLMQSVTATGAQAAVRDHDARLIADMGLEAPAAPATAPAPAARPAPANEPAVAGVANAALTYAPVFRLAL